MKEIKYFSLFSALLIITLFFTACGSDQDLAVVVALTQTAAAQDAAVPQEQPEAAPQKSPQPEIPEGDMQPLSPTECDSLASGTGQILGLTFSNQIVPVTMSWSGEVGSACQMTASGDGNKFEDIFEPSDALQNMMLLQGWSGGDMLSPCLGHGGAGPGAVQSCYVNETKICEAMVTLEPVDMKLCEGIEGPIGLCMAELTPEQKSYTIRLTCAQGKLAVPMPKTEPERIQFAAGAISAQAQGGLGPQGLGQYVLYAMQDQVMTVNLYPSRPALLVIWGLDGTVLISDHAETTFWSGTLPLSQDYYIDVRSLSGERLDYTLSVSIPPAPKPASGQVFPMIEPFGFGEMQSIVLNEVPPMLPPEFPVEAGLPEIVPYLITGMPDEYEFSLDYGYDCHGAGACHYGVITGMRTASPVPVGTSTFPFEADRAEQIILANGITGYFVDATCGANCNDSQVWWVYSGYQYSIGLKAGPKDLVVALANAAIANSIP